MGTDLRFRLPDGRQLGFAEYGDPDGRPLFYFHGWPGSRYEARLIDPLCRKLGLRLLAPDRPGYGLSDFQKGRTFLHWPADVSALADHLGIDKFSVLGISGGGPYAVACGGSMAERLHALLLVSPVGPADSKEALEGMVRLNRMLLTFARRAPWLAERIAGICLRAVWGTGRQVIPEAIEKRLPALDIEALRNQELRDALIASSVEAFRHGHRAAVADGLLYARPWGFALDKVTVPVHLWHGQSDVVVPPGMGRYLARELPHCHATFYPLDGHFSLAWNRTREILQKIPFS